VLLIKLIEAVALLISIEALLTSNFGRDIDYPDICNGFP
jgi:hypothetical protein